MKYNLSPRNTVFEEPLSSVLPPMKYQKIKKVDLPRVRLPLPWVPCSIGTDWDRLGRAWYLMGGVEPIEFGDKRVSLFLWAKVEMDEESDCWIWTGRYTPTGWPVHSHKSVWRVIYRKTQDCDAPVALATVKGCAEKACVNPYHRVFLTDEDNKSSVWTAAEMAAARVKSHRDEETRMTTIQRKMATHQEDDDEEEMDHLIDPDYEVPDDGTPLPVNIRPPETP